MALDLVATDELFLSFGKEERWLFAINVNDMFYPAADGEGISMDKIPEVWKVWKEGNWPAVVRWVQAKRDGLPLRKRREENILTIENLQRRAKLAESRASAAEGERDRMREALRQIMQDAEHMEFSCDCGTEEHPGPKRPCLFCRCRELAK